MLAVGTSGVGSWKNSSGAFSGRCSVGTGASGCSAGAELELRVGAGAAGAANGVGTGASSLRRLVISSPGLTATGSESITRPALSSTLSLADAMRLAALANLALPTSDVARYASTFLRHVSE